MRIIPESPGNTQYKSKFPPPPQCMPASLATVSVASGPASHAHPVASKRLRNQTPHAHAACCVGVPAVSGADHVGRTIVGNGDVGRGDPGAICGRRERREQPRRPLPSGVLTGFSGVGGCGERPPGDQMSGLQATGAT
jgi:hypothetical protein